MAAASDVKRWGGQEFWGVGSDYDPDWVLTEAHKQLQKDVIELCRTTLRPNAIKSDAHYTYPRDNMNALAGLGLMGLLIPKELGGMGENHTCATMVTETIARYGCPSTALVYVMHLGACSSLCFRAHFNPKLNDVLRRVNKEKLIGTQCYSDPSTGGHFWYPLSSKSQMTNDGEHIKLLKYASWTTSAGCADWYVVQTISPNFNGDYSNMTCYLIWKNEIRADTSQWSALGMHGNQSGSMVADATVHKDRLVGPFGDGARSNDEIVDPIFMLLTSATWNGLSMAGIDIAKKQVTSKVHADVGIRVCDYPTIQDYFGEHVSATNAERCFTFSLAYAMDKKTNNCDWTIHKDMDVLPRYTLLHWCWQVKFTTARNVTLVLDKMLHASGGTGFKTELGLERLLRDSKAAWVMGPSNEVVRQFVGGTVLLGMDHIDYWAQKVNHRQVHEEVKKMTLDEKKTFAERLMKEVKMAEEAPLKKDKVALLQDKDFDNPLNTCAATASDSSTSALKPGAWIQCKVLHKKNVTLEGMEEIRLGFTDNKKTLGTLPGQYIELGVKASDGKIISRPFSPVSDPAAPGYVDICIKYESCGQFSELMENVKDGDEVQVRGPCGGFEYVSDKLDNLILIVSGAGATPAVQIIRAVCGNKQDKTKISMMYYAETTDDFLYKSELDKYASSSGGQVNISYSIGEYEEGWTGDVGYINASMLRKFLPNEKERGRFKIVLCGGPSMVVTCVELLYMSGSPSNSIFIFGAFAAELIRRVYGRQASLSTHCLS